MPTIPKFIKATDDLFVYSEVGGVAQPGATTQAQMQEFMRNNSDVLQCLVAGLWQPQTAYSVNDIVQSPNMPAGLVAKVTTAGTTGSSEPSWSSTVGATVADGNVRYTMQMLVRNIATTKQLQAGIDNTTIVTPAGLTSARPLKTYISWGELGFTVTDGIDIKDVCDALPTNSMFVGIVWDGDTDKITNLPIKSKGKLFIYKTGGESTLYFITLSRQMYCGWSTTTFCEWVGILPTGTILPFAGGTIPNGFLACNGAAVSRTTYSALYSAIGTTYGSGDGSTTFNLPLAEDNRFLEFASTAGTKKNAGLPNITGGPTSTGIGGTANRDDVWVGALATRIVDEQQHSRDGSTNPYYGLTQTSLDASKSSSIYGGSTTVQPKSLTVRAIIKY